MGGAGCKCTADDQRLYGEVQRAMGVRRRRRRGGRKEGMGEMGEGWEEGRKGGKGGMGGGEEKKKMRYCNSKDME